MQARGNEHLLPEELRKPPPEIPKGAEFFWNDFWELNTTRQLGMSEGPIPWDKIKKYADSLSLTYEDFHDMLNVIREMDSVYLEFRKSEAEKPQKSADSSIPSGKQARGFKSKNRK